MEYELTLEPEESKVFRTESEGKKFDIEIILSSNITFEIKELETIQYMFYYNEFSLEKLVKLNKIFKVCETITEAFDILVEILESERFSIKQNKDNSIILIIEIQPPVGKTHKVELSINKKKELNKNVIIERLVKTVNFLEEKNKNLESKNQKLEEEINKIKEWKKEIERLFKDKVKEDIKSLIIENITDLNFLKDRLINISPNLKPKKIIFNLLYRATRDGDNFNDFHLKVDNKDSTLTIIKTNLGFKFGVYLYIPIKQVGYSVKDNKSFIFSLDLKKIYNSNKSGNYNLNDIQSNNGTLLNLNYHPILININCLSNNKSYTATSVEANNSYSNFERDYELNNNEKYFTVAEMETFQVSFN